MRQSRLASLFRNNDPTPAHQPSAFVLQIQRQYSLICIIRSNLKEAWNQESRRRRDGKPTASIDEDELKARRALIYLKLIEERLANYVPKRMRSSDSRQSDVDDNDTTPLLRSRDCKTRQKRYQGQRASRFAQATYDKIKEAGHWTVEHVKIALKKTVPSRRRYNK